MTRVNEAEISYKLVILNFKEIYHENIYISSLTAASK